METTLGVTALVLAARGIWLALRALWRLLKPHLGESESGNPYASSGPNFFRQP